jgi:hypothetical protein
LPVAASPPSRFAEGDEFSIRHLARGDGELAMGAAGDVPKIGTLQSLGPSPEPHVSFTWASSFASREFLLSDARILH